MVALEPNNPKSIDDLQLRGLSIISQSETPGLGDKITQSTFLDRFKGIFFPGIELSENGGDIDGITGATISSKAVISGIVSSLENKFDSLLQLISNVEVD